MKKLLFKQRSDTPHWVGDGFPVRSMFTYHENVKEFSPFLLMDYAGPMQFEPSTHIRGVGEHPHRGFETVTIVYSGEVVHKDSSGGGGKIGPGDVQWMTAASGLVHEEMHSKKFSESGGIFEMVQLWVNLPAKDKMTPPRYQGISSENIAVVETDGAVVRVIAGQFEGAKGPARTFTDIDLWDVRLRQGKAQVFTTGKEHNTLVFVLDGRVELNDGSIIGTAELAKLDKSSDSFSLKALDDAKLLILAGAPINEPVVGHGPFVMNTQKEILEALVDFQNGKMGSLVSELQPQDSP